MKTSAELLFVFVSEKHRLLEIDKIQSINLDASESDSFIWSRNRRTCGAPLTSCAEFAHIYLDAIANPTASRLEKNWSCLLFSGSYCGCDI